MASGLFLALSNPMGGEETPLLLQHIIPRNGKSLELYSLVIAKVEVK